MGSTLGVMKRSVVRLAGLALFLLALAANACAEWQDAGKLAPGAPQGNSITFRGPRATATITALAPDLVCVRMTRAHPSALTIPTPPSRPIGRTRPSSSNQARMPNPSARRLSKFTFSLTRSA